ncbi:hypothetical protein [Streptosporangium roseum]|uniref:hypothetical protein n=1 Tax=Streptosporangium roseum TaxID=2001 RepID=UPI003318B0B0
MTALACALAVSTACRGEEVKVDRSPLPTVAAPPYLCDHIPLKAVELMTGVRDPVVRGYFDFTTASGIGIGNCVIRRPGGDRPVVLVIDLTPGGYVGEIEERIEDGASPMPEIVPGAIGSYFRRASGQNNAAFAMLVRGKAEINIQLEIGVAGRDNAADVLALMKLIAPKLLTDASAPPAKTTSPSPSPTKE